MVHARQNILTNWATSLAPRSISTFISGIWLHCFSSYSYVVLPVWIAYGFKKTSFFFSFPWLFNTLLSLLTRLCISASWFFSDKILLVFHSTPRLFLENKQVIGKLPWNARLRVGFSCLISRKPCGVLEREMMSRAPSILNKWSYQAIKIFGLYLK